MRGVALIVVQFMLWGLPAGPLASPSPSDAAVTPAAASPAAAPTPAAVPTATQTTKPPSTSPTRTPPVGTTPPTATPTLTPTPSPTTATPVPYRIQPVAGPIFNNPYGTLDEQYRVIRYMTGVINNAPAGSTVRIAMYSLNIDDTADAIINAKRRGVNVKFVTDDHGIGTKQMKRVIAELGSVVNNTGAGSFIKICDFSCSSDYVGLDLLTGEEIRPYLHAKYLTFDRAGTSAKVTMTTSSNFTKTQANEGFNNLYTTIGDTRLYDFLVDRFVLMTRDLNAIAAYKTATSGTSKMYFFPYNTGTITDTTTDTFYSILRNVRCTGVARGYGTYPTSPTKSRTRVTVSMFQWSRARLAAARQLKALNNAGCDVKVIMSANDWDPEVGRVLLASGGKYGNIEIRNADVDVDKDKNMEKFVHNKYILVNGKYLSDTSSKLVFTGSANFTRAALRYNNETALKIDGSSVYGKYLDNFNLIYGKYSRVYYRP